MARSPRRSPTHANIRAALRQRPFVQTFATTILFEDHVIPELIFGTLPLDSIPPASGAMEGRIDELIGELAELEDEDEVQELQFRDFKQLCDAEFVKQTIAMHLRNGVVGRISRDNAHFDYYAQEIYEKAEIPITSSPLNGVTLASLVSSAGTASVLQLFHSGVTPEQALMSVLFAGGTMVFFGAANGARRAVENGVEHIVGTIFGKPPMRRVAEARNKADKERRAKSKRTTPTRAATTTGQRVAMTTARRITQAMAELPARSTRTPRARTRSD